MKKKMKITFNAPVVLGFVTICLVATMLNYLTRGKTNELLFMTYRSSMKSPMTYVRLLLHVFGHADWNHFIGNASYILLLGPMLEEKYSSKVLVEVICITAVITGLLNSLFFGNMALCGASGVVFAFILLSSFTGFKEGEIPVTFLLITLLYVGKELIQGFMTVDNISNMAHIVGGIIGAAIGYGMNIKGRE